MEQKARWNAVIRALSGNVLEVYDYVIYGFYASYIAAAFFPAGGEFLSLMLSLTTFGIAAFARPFGAVILGSYIDRKGRRAGLLLTLALMSVGSLGLAITPTYASIGLLAPLLIVCARLIQGFAFGVESSGVNVYLGEIAPPGRRGFYTSLQQASQGLVTILAAAIGLALAMTMSNEKMAAWGWRVPFIVGCLVIPVLFWLRRSLAETEAYLSRRPPQRTKDVLGILAPHWPQMILCIGMWSMGTVGFYMVSVYTPTFGNSVLHLPVIASLVVTVFAGLTIFMATAYGGALSDRFGRWPVVAVPSLVILCTAFPAFSWLVAAPSFLNLLVVELWLAFWGSLFAGAVSPLVAELMPEAARTSGMAIVISFGSGLFGSFTPAINTLLIEVTGNRAAPALWLTLTAAVALASAFAAKRVAGLPSLREATV